MIFFAVEGFGNRTAWTARVHRRHEAIFLQCRPVAGADQVVALNTEIGGDATGLFKGRAAAENAARDALFEAALAGGGTLCLRSGGGKCERREELAAVHLSTL